MNNLARWFALGYTYFSVATNHGVDATCKGIMNVTAASPEISDLRKNQYQQAVGQIVYSLDRTGDLNLTSHSNDWVCGPIMNFVSSNGTAGKLEKKKKQPPPSTQAILSVGAQLHCHNKPTKLSTEYATPWNTIAFYGSLFVQIEMEGDACRKPAELILDYSRCSYNTTTSTNKNYNGLPCVWSANSTVEAPGHSSA